MGLSYFKYTTVIVSEKKVKTPKCNKTYCHIVGHPGIFGVKKVLGFMHTHMIGQVIFLSLFFSVFICLVPSKVIMNSKTVYALRHVIYICFRLFSESF